MKKSESENEYNCIIIGTPVDTMTVELDDDFGTKITISDFYKKIEKKS